MKKNILFVSSLPDNHQVQVTTAALNGALKYKYPGTCDLYHYMGPPDWNTQHILLDKHPVPIQLSPDTHYLINQVAEPDTHTFGLARVQQLMKEYPHLSVFNPPEAVAMTRRDRVYQRLKHIPGLVVPPTVRFMPRSPQDIAERVALEGMQYPVIVKGAGVHNGQQMVRLDSPDHHTPLDALALDGRPYYLIQYYETAQEGLYKKHRLVMVRGQVFPRHLCVLDHWAIAFPEALAFMAKHAGYFAEEADFIAQFDGKWGPLLSPLARQIYSALPMDFVGLDCCLLPDGRVLLFELNANMLLLRSSSTQQAPLDAIVRIKTALHEACNQDMEGICRA